MTMTMNMTDLAGQGQMPPEVAEMMKGIRLAMTGSAWIASNAPGAVEFAAYNKAVRSSNLLSAISGKSGGLEKKSSRRLHARQVCRTSPSCSSPSRAAARWWMR